MKRENSPHIIRIRNSLTKNPSCRGGLFSQPNVFVTEKGPSLGPEMLVLIFSDEQWGDRFWYGHIMRFPEGDGFAAGLFRSYKFINGPSEELLFERLFHWTVVDPQIQAPNSILNVDLFGIFSDFGKAVRGLSLMIEDFDETHQGVSSRDIKPAGEPDTRITDFYEAWGAPYASTAPWPIPPLVSRKHHVE